MVPSQKPTALVAVRPKRSKTSTFLFKAPRSGRGRLSALLAATVLAGVAAHFSAVRAQNEGKKQVASVKLPYLNSDLDVEVPGRPVKKRHNVKLSFEFARLNEKMKGMVFKPAVQDSDGTYVYPAKAFTVKADGVFTPGKVYAGPESNWKLTRARRRTTPNGPWIDEDPKVLMFFTTEENQFESMRRFNALVDPILNKTGEWDLQGVFTVSTRNVGTGEIFSGSKEFSQRFYAFEIPPSSGSRRYIQLPKAITPIVRSIQYRILNVTEWKDAPKPGQPGYPVRVRSTEFLEIRAVHRKPGAAWPREETGISGEGYLPIWRVDMDGQVSEKSNTGRWGDGDLIIKKPDRLRRHLVKIRASAGNFAETAFLLNAEKKFVQEPVYPTGPNAPKEWASSIEYSIGDGAPLKRAPLPGSPGFPLRIPVDSTVYWRAVFKPHQPGQPQERDTVITDSIPFRREWEARCLKRSSEVDAILKPGELMVLGLKSKSGPYDDEENMAVSPGDIVQIRFNSGERNDEQVATAIQVVSNKPGMASPPPISIPRPVKFQISEGANGKWLDVPQPGHPRYPMPVYNEQYYNLRLVLSHRVDPTLYKALGLYGPIIHTGYAGREDDSYDDWTKANFRPSRLSANNTDLYTVFTKELGGLKTGFRVVQAPPKVSVNKNGRGWRRRTGMPTLDILPSEGVYYSRNKTLALKRYNLPVSRITVQIHSEYKRTDAVSYPQIRIVARHRDGKPAGQINGPGTADDVITRTIGGGATFNFEADNRPGLVTLEAHVLGTNGSVLRQAKLAGLRFAEVKLYTQGGDWQPSPGRSQTWEREIYAIAQWQNIGTSSAPPSLLEGVPVSLALSAPNKASAKNSWLSGASATTIRPNISKRLPGELSIKQYWTWSPQGSRNLDFYRVTAQWHKTPARPAARVGGPL